MPTVPAGSVEKVMLRPLHRSARVGALGLLSALALASLAGPAIAQGSAPPAQETDEASTVEDRLVLLSFSRCVVGRQPTQARALVLADYTTDAYRDSLRRMATGQRNCLPTGGRLRFGGVLFAGDLAETLLASAAPAGSLAARAALNPAAAPFRARDQSEVMSVCLVRAVPAEAEALFATQQGSAAEAAAVRVIAPHIGSCLASGTEMRLNRAGLRAMLALTAYRLVQHNAPAPAAVAAGN